jgi:hypothetical protein
VLYLLSYSPRRFFATRRAYLTTRTTKGHENYHLIGFLAREKGEKLIDGCNPRFFRIH